MEDFIYHLSFHGRGYMYDFPPGQEYFFHTKQKSDHFLTLKKQ